MLKWVQVLIGLKISKVREYSVMWLQQHSSVLAQERITSSAKLAYCMRPS